MAVNTQTGKIFKGPESTRIDLHVGGPCSGETASAGWGGHPRGSMQSGSKCRYQRN